MKYWARSTVSVGIKRKPISLSTHRVELIDLSSGLQTALESRPTTVKGFPWLQTKNDRELISLGLIQDKLHSPAVFQNATEVQKHLNVHALPSQTQDMLYAISLVKHDFQQSHT